MTQDRLKVILSPAFALRVRNPTRTEELASANISTGRHMEEERAYYEKKTV
jgi:hypothetical protein